MSTSQNETKSERHHREYQESLKRAGSFTVDDVTGLITMLYTTQEQLEAVLVLMEGVKAPEAAKYDKAGHPLQQTLRDNGDLIAAQATIAQQAQMIKHLQDTNTVMKNMVTALASKPEVVLVGMLQGHIAKLSVRSFLKTHGEVLNGDEAQLLEIARLREELNVLKAAMH